MPLSPFSKSNGLKCWQARSTDSYLATGRDRSGKRFSIMSARWSHCSCINVWRGNKWLIRDGKRHHIQSIQN